MIITFGTKEKSVSLTGIRAIFFWLITIGNILYLLMPVYSAIVVDFSNHNKFLDEMFYYDATYFNDTILGLILGKGTIYTYVMGSILMVGVSYYWIIKIFFNRQKSLENIKNNIIIYILASFIIDILIFDFNEISFMSIFIVIFFFDVVFNILTLYPILKYEKYLNIYKTKIKENSKKGFSLLTILFIIFLGNMLKKLPLTIDKIECEKGNAVVCTQIGNLYRNGNDVKVEKDFFKAKYFYKKGCNGGNAVGCNNLASLYENGQGVKQNLQKAEEYYTKACSLGLKSACGK